MKDKLKSLPSSPGVYLMKDSSGGILYVGKSKNLKQRVQSYFYNTKGHSNKTKRLVNNIKELEIRLTDTEFEAFMLECKLIHELKPVYNKKMRNPLAYSYIVIRSVKGLRRIFITNCLQTGDKVCFGPYTANRNTIEKAVQGIQECYKISCNQTSAGTPCLNHSLGLCLGMCLGGEAIREYDTIMNSFIALLEGSDRGLYGAMEQRMLQASETFDFETAAKYRDYIGAVDFLLNKEKVIGFTEENRNIVVVENLDGDTVKLFLIKRNHILYSEKFSVKAIEIDGLCSTVRGLVQSRFRQDGLSGDSGPNELTRDEIDEAQIIYSYLQGSSSRYLIIPGERLEGGDPAEIGQALRELLTGSQKTPVPSK
ncbi:excinuclease ABC subunit C [Fontibacillus phaseoli]|uniref:Excinuclease ABC subunit C n=1 Tax=Fontibacillus phaseoli TaxID=1416533 RepID=A0A369BP91_9BACL|nr:GIY-YIG nuclease family protein [Fontibacillus phaseoli]RCX23439.1 excinuclease ABC subunit C [Fontibacillus phaseoli]